MAIPLRIDEMFAFIAQGENGDEGVMGCSTSQGMMPLVGADMDRVKSLIPLADIVRETTGKDYKIIKFSKREEITSLCKNSR